MVLPTRPLGQSAVQITRVGLGTAPLGSTPDWELSWGPHRAEDAVRASATALEQGVNWIDTAPYYGWGRAEELVGTAVQGQRDKVYLFTKCGTVRTAQGAAVEDLSPAGIRRGVEASLRRLRTDYIDLLQFHDPDPHTPIEASWATMQALIREGVVRYGALSNHPPDLIARALRVGPVTALQHQYNLLERAIEAAILPLAQQRGLGVLAWSPLASGFLTAGFALERLDPQDFRRRHRYAHEPAATRLQAVRTQLAALARAHNRPLADLAIAWVLREPVVTGAIMGIRAAREARAMTGGVDWTLTAAEREAIEQVLTVWTDSAS